MFKPANGRRRRAGPAGWARPMGCRLSALTDRRTHTHLATRAPPCPTRAARASVGCIVRPPTPRCPASSLRSHLSPRPGSDQSAAPPAGPDAGRVTQGKGRGGPASRSLAPAWPESPSDPKRRPAPPGPARPDYSSPYASHAPDHSRAGALTHRSHGEGAVPRRDFPSSLRGGGQPEPSRPKPAQGSATDRFLALEVLSLRHRRLSQLWGRREREAHLAQFQNSLTQPNQNKAIARAAPGCD